MNKSLIGIFAATALLSVPTLASAESPIDVPGIETDCSMKTTFGKPRSADCATTVSPGGTVILDTLASEAVTNVICFAVAAETAEAFQPICSRFLGDYVTTTVKPALSGCVAQNKGFKLELDLSVIPPKMDSDAACT